jgi:hypothetical protein
MPYCGTPEMIKAHYLRAPETQIGVHTMDTVKTWDDSPRAIQLLRTIDSAVYGADCSTFVIRTLELFLDRAIADEQTTYEALVKRATWRDNR